MKKVIFNLSMMLIIVSTVLTGCNKKDDTPAPVVKTTQQKMIAKWAIVKLTSKEYSSNNVLINTTEIAGTAADYVQFNNNSTYVLNFNSSGTSSGTYLILNDNSFTITETGGDTTTEIIKTLIDNSFIFEESSTDTSTGNKTVTTIELSK